MKVVVLSSSRADYGIYSPLLKLLQKDPDFDLGIIAFGTHLSALHGNTIQNIVEDGYSILVQLENQQKGDEPKDIAAAIGATQIEFSSIWAEHQDQIDLVLALGDRYEMFAAVSAAVPFGIPIAHFHGGETTLGSIDNQFRHAISLMSKYHFTAAGSHADRVKELIGSSEGVYAVGAMGLDNIKNLELLDVARIKDQLGVDMRIPTLLFTFHPETVNYEENAGYLQTLMSVLEKTDHQIILSYPNADTKGDTLRSSLESFVTSHDKVYGFESLGTLVYLSCMKHAYCLLGNSSSGILEAASFGKYVIDVGARQEGRLSGKNVLHAAIDEEEILEAFKQIASAPALNGDNPYGDGQSAARVLDILKQIDL